MEQDTGSESPISQNQGLKLFPNWGSKEGICPRNHITVGPCLGVLG